MKKDERESVFDKVLFIGPGITGLGGMQKVMQSYRQALPTFTYLPSNSKYGTLAGLFVVFASLLRMPWMRWVRHKKILHVHSASGKSYTRKSVFLRFGKLLGFRTIFHSHGGGMKDFAARKGEKKIAKFLSRQDQILVLTEQWRKYFADDLGLKDSMVLNNIVNRPTVEPKPADASRPLTVLFLGRVETQKGIYDLLEAIGAHQDELRGKMSLRIGGNDVEHRLNSVIDQLGIGDMVTPLGWVSGDDKDREVAAADVITLPSYYEGLPISVLEAMASGRGLITTGVGGIPSIVTDRVNGFLVTPGDKEGMVEALKQYIHHRDLIATHGSESLKRVEPFYPENIVDSLRTIYQNVLNK